MPGETKKYEEAVKNESYYNCSKEAKHYLKVLQSQCELNFFNNSSTKYECSSSLEKINLYEKIEWKRNEK